VLRTKVKELGKTLSALEKELSSIETRAESLREVIHSEEDSIFAEFCERIGVDDIREYEEKQLRGAQEDHAQMLKYETQLARLDTQYASFFVYSSNVAHSNSSVESPSTAINLRRFKNDMNPFKRQLPLNKHSLTHLSRRRRRNKLRSKHSSRRLRS